MPGCCIVPHKRLDLKEHHKLRLPIPNSFLQTVLEMEASNLVIMDSDVEDASFFLGDSRKFIVPKAITS